MNNRICLYQSREFFMDSGQGKMEWDSGCGLRVKLGYYLTAGLRGDGFRMDTNVYYGIKVTKSCGVDHEEMSFEDVTSDLGRGREILGLLANSFVTPFGLSEALEEIFATDIPFIPSAPCIQSEFAREEGKYVKMLKRAFGRPLAIHGKNCK